MNNLVLIDDRINKILDIKASYVAIEECLKILNINTLDEVKYLKLVMKETLKTIEETSK
jgi:hypothetical protein